MINQSPSPTPLRVLVVEDSPVNQKLLAGLLRPLDCQISLAGNGQEAVDLYKRDRFDVVFMDVQMPVMDGLTATRLIRDIESGRSTHTYIVAVTAGVERQACIEAGMDDYLPKPVRPKCVHDTLQRVAGETPETSSSDLA